MGHWTRYRIAEVCRHCGTEQQPLAPRYIGKNPKAFCEACANRMGFETPADLPAEPVEPPQERHALPTFARFDKGRAAEMLASTDGRAKRAGMERL